jgi:hypothetical protein
MIDILYYFTPETKTCAGRKDGRLNGVLSFGQIKQARATNKQPAGVNDCMSGEE